MVRKKKIQSVAPSMNMFYFGSYDEKETIGQILIRQIRNAGSFTTGDSAEPSVILWTDPERFWEVVIGELQKQMPELYIFGPYSPEQRTGPAIWLKCIESRSIKAPHAENSIPIFYLPGVSRQQLFDAENCPPEYQPLVEYQYRGSVWLHPDMKDWTPFSFLSSEQGGLGLDLSKDEATKAALQRALPILLDEKPKDLSTDHIDADFINQLITPDFPRELLRWMNNQDQVKRTKTSEEWITFINRAEREYGFHPEKDGKLRAAQLVAQHQDKWDAVWERFKEAPKSYPQLIEILYTLEPPKDLNGAALESYPAYNKSMELELADELLGLKSKRRDETAAAVIELDKRHGFRRDFVWARIEHSQFVCALEHLVNLAKLTEKPLNAPTMTDLAAMYSKEGWKTDEELLNTLACCVLQSQEEPIRIVAQNLYIDWLDKSANNLQESIKRENNRVKPVLRPVQTINGQIILFIDGLRLDLAHRLIKQLIFVGLQPELSSDWSPYPPITQTSKYFISPISNLLDGDPSSSELIPKISESGHLLSQDRFEELLKKEGFQVVDTLSNGDPNGKAWTESGTIDQTGHNSEWKLARNIDRELKDIADRIVAFFEAGWQEVVVVTDHGWLLVPIEFPHKELPKFLTDLKWGRCAILKGTATTNLQIIPWYWNELVSVTSPQGACCFRRGMQYTHGGISLQELIVPRISIKRDSTGLSMSRISEPRWIGLRCQIRISNPTGNLSIDIRTRVADPDSSLLERKMPREISSDGTVSLPIPDTDNEGKRCHIVLINKDGAIIHSVSTIIGGGS